MSETAAPRMDESTRAGAIEITGDKNTGRVLWSSARHDQLKKTDETRRSARPRAVPQMLRRGFSAIAYWTELMNEPLDEMRDMPSDQRHRRRVTITMRPHQ